MNPIECPKCKEVALVVIHYGSDYDEYECEECKHYQTMGKDMYEDLKEAVDDAITVIDSFEREVNAMRPVVEAAITYFDLQERHQPVSTTKKYEAYNDVIIAIGEYVEWELDL